MPNFKPIVSLSNRSLKGRWIQIGNIEIREISNCRTSTSSTIQTQQPPQFESISVPSISDNSEEEIILCDISDVSDNEKYETNTENKEKVASFLRTWKFKNNLTSTAVNELLCFLKENGHPYLP